MIPNSHLIGIGITTKDRWDDLAITLHRLREEGLDALETVVVDDGSSVPLSSEFEQKFPWIKFSRSEPSQGLIAQRNRIARLLSTPFVLGLDDDSFPVAGNLDAAAKWLTQHPAVVALALAVVFKGETVPEAFLTKAPFPVRDYIGCANLVNRETFLAMGGYEERFEFFTEEAEFCLRAIQQGYEIYAYPAVVVQHNVTPVGRNLVRRGRQFIRNEMLVALWFFPFPECYLRAVRALPGILIKNREWRKYWRSLVQGYFEAFYCFATWPKQKERLTMEQFRDWKMLPMATDVVMGSRG